MRITAMLTVGVAILSPVLYSAVHGSEHSAAPERVLRIYNIADLPVWRQGGKDTKPEFGPEVLIKYLRLTVEPNSWDAGAEIRPFAKDASLIISQTSANHKKVAESLESFRRADAREAVESRTN